MAEIQNFLALQAKLKALQKKGAEKPSVVVGYTAEYALYVHENLQAHHPNGQAKFLEEPARRLQPELRRMIADGAKQGLPLGKNLYIAGLRLQRESQKAGMCPRKTGNLAGSAVTRLENE